MAEPTVIKDPMYSFEIARRAVGRAALHLGIDSMTEQALDVMADVLLQYLARTGRALSHLAESSRRTSAHVNVLDAFQACQLVTSSAVNRLHLQENEEEEEETMVAPKAAEGVTAEGASTNGTSPVAGAPTNGEQAKSKTSPSASSTSWKGLATFVFGPNWLQEKDEEEIRMELAAAKSAENNNSTETEISTVAPGGGKVFPAALENGDGDEGDATNPSRRKRKKGWDAPYLDEVLAFPRASSNCANPHALPPKVTGGLTSAASVYRKVDVDADEADEDEQEALNELEALSDKVFLPETIEDSGLDASGWGSIDGKNKRTREQAAQNPEGKDEDGDVEMQPSSAKKIKFQEGSKSGDGKKSSKVSPEEPEEDDFLYVPSFYPRPPSTKVVVDDRRTVVDGKDDRQQRLLQQQRTQEQQEQQVFASSESLEGMSTTLRDASSRGIQSSLIRLGSNGYWGSGWDKASSSTNRLAVPMGRKIVTPSTPGGKVAPEDPIVPMSRASGSRVSRVLEGSMDAAAMQ